MDYKLLKVIKLMFREPDHNKRINRKKCWISLFCFARRYFQITPTTLFEVKNRHKISDSFIIYFFRTKAHMYTLYKLVWDLCQNFFWDKKHLYYGFNFLNHESITTVYYLHIRHTSFINLKRNVISAFFPFVYTFVDIFLNFIFV